MTKIEYIENIELEDGVMVVKVTGDVTFNTLADIKNEFREKIKGLKIKNILFDLKNVSAVDSASVAGLIDLLKYMKAHRRGNKVGLINYPPDIVSLQQVLKVDPLIIEFQSRQKAIANLR